MQGFNRRNFLKSGAALALAGLAGPAGLATAADERSAKPVYFKGDGLNLAPAEQARLLQTIAAADDFERDYYANGGIISDLERRFANLLGKETAVFLPTGTMANHIALRRLSGARGRVLVQAGSHIFNDSGDCAQELSGLNLVPIEGEFSAAALGRAFDQARSGRVTTEVGAVSLESPLRRGHNSAHDLNRAAEIASFARAEGIGLHLDGARMFMQAAHQGCDPADLAAPFDTVYVSLYKNFNAAGGAVLAGSEELLADLYHERRMFGGSPYSAWPLAAVAILFAESFIEDYRAARKVTDRMLEILQADSRFVFDQVPEGTNSFWLRPDGFAPEDFIDHLATKNIHLMPPRPEWDGLLMMINPTISRMTAEEVAAHFAAAADDSSR